MKIYYANLRNAPPFAGNFGDELNTWIWPELAPGVFDDDPSVAFVGIGTILNKRLNGKFPRTIVFGSGWGFFAPPLFDATWKVYCVRGEMTAKAVGLPASCGIADPGILVNQVFKATGEKKFRFGFMPHVFEVTNGGDEMFRRACEPLGIHLIDPRWEMEKVMEDITSCEVLITAAMHGSIAADAMRVPWIPVVTNAGIPEFKWTDWCSSVGLRYEPHKILRFSRMNRYFAAYTHIESSIVRMRLSSIMKAKPFLSKDAIMEQRTSQLLEKIDEFRRDVAAGVFVAPVSAAAAAAG